MHVTLQMSGFKSLPFKLDAPYKGGVAIAAGKRKLEDDFGVTVEFDSYQENPSKAKQKLDDDAAVTRGAVFNYAVDIDKVLRRKSEYDQMLALALEPVLLDTVSSFGSRLVTPVKVTSAVYEKTKLADTVASSRELHLSLTTALSTTAPNISVEKFAEALDNTYKMRNESTHINTNEMLQKKMERLRKSGVLKLLEADYPIECIIVQKYEVFLQLLQ